jgi:hypothetical protein
MTMKTLVMLVRALGVAALVLVVGTSVALAHGTPTIAAQPATVAAGGKVTLSADGMGSDGQTVTITLKGMLFQAQLGTAKLSDDHFDGVTLMVPAKAPPGTYLIVGQNGAYNASVSIEVTAAAPAPKPTAAPTAKPTAVPTALPTAVPTVAPTAMPTAMSGMATPAATATQEAKSASITTAQTTAATPVATTESTSVQSVATAPATAQPTAARSDATAETPVATAEPATQPGADNAAATSAPADQTTTGAVMPMPGTAPVLVRARGPIEWGLPIGVVVVGGALGLFLVTRDW